MLEHLEAVEFTDKFIAVYKSKMLEQLKDSTPISHKLQVTDEVFRGLMNRLRATNKPAELLETEYLRLVGY